MWAGELFVLIFVFSVPQDILVQNQKKPNIAVPYREKLKLSVLAV